jgi:hypothetical protein
MFPHTPLSRWAWRLWKGGCAGTDGEVPQPHRAVICLSLCIRWWLLLDSRVVEVPTASNATFVLLSSLKSLFLNSLQNEL